MKVIHAFSIAAALSSVAGVRAEDLKANEIAAAAACKAFAEANEIFRRTDYDADGILEYAQALKGGPAPAPEVDPKKVPQASEEEKKKIADLIKAMANDEFQVREKAATELAALETKPLEQLKAALKTEKDPEIINRCRKLIAVIERKLSPASPVPEKCNLFELTPGTGDLSLIDKDFANAECYLGADPSKIPAKNGYLFRVLHKQGPDATGGRRQYVVNGNMTLGYALLAFPKEYGVTGKKVFIINNNGTIFERDLGDKEKTEKFAKECDEFNPSKDWAASE
ncbi:MAG TPA: DUF2950 family protein [Planctomycetota bacterium]|nr:DUF2950 family protein [Planctomycetota bacterium]